MISTVGHIQQYCFNYSLKHYTTQRWEKNKESTVQYRREKESMIDGMTNMVKNITVFTSLY